MATSTTKITLSGGMVAGTIELKKLATFSADLQNAIDEMAYSLERNRGSRADRSQIIYETTVSLVGIEEGSTSLLIEPTSKTEMPIYPNLIENSVENLIQGIDIVRQYTSDLQTELIFPRGWDESVVQKVIALGKIFKEGVNEFEVAITREGNTVSAIYDPPTLAKLQQLKSEKRERIESVTGALLQVDFVERVSEHYRCRIYPNFGKKDYISCQFDEELSELIEASIRRTVGAIGIARYDSITNQITNFDIKQIIVYELGTDINEFDATVRRALRSYRTENDTLTSFETGWKQIVAGETHDISTLWDDLDDD